MLIRESKKPSHKYSGSHTSYVEQRLLLFKLFRPQIAILPTAVIYLVLMHCRSCLSVYSVVLFASRGLDKRRLSTSAAPWQGQLRTERLRLSILLALEESEL